jgi:uncharacterized protein YjcR
MTPNELASELGISPKTLRAWLRENFSRGHAPYERWELSAREVEQARARWA